MKNKINTAKLLMPLLIVGGGIGIIYLISRISKKKGEQNPQGNILTNPTNAPLEVSVVKPTLTDAKLRSHVNTLFKAFNGTGTDEEAIYSVFTDVKNDEDFNNLVVKFGTKKIDGGWFRSDFKGNLRSVIKNELSEAEIKFLNEILQGNGVSKQFTY
jgi:hypothetical protein